MHPFPEPPLGIFSPLYRRHEHRNINVLITSATNFYLGHILLLRYIRVYYHYYCIS